MQGGLQTTVLPGYFLLVPGEPYYSQKVTIMTVIKKMSLLPKVLKVTKEHY